VDELLESWPQNYDDGKLRRARLWNARTPRNYYSTAAATIKDFSEEEFTAAVLGGKIVISAGAFANVSRTANTGVGDLVP
jgi:hypothetical protein